MFKLLVDAQYLKFPRTTQRGVGRYITGLIRGLLNHPDIELHLSCLDANLIHLPESIDRNSVTLHSFRDVANPREHGPNTYSIWLDSIGADHAILCSTIPSGPAESLPVHPQLLRCTTSIIAYDTIPYQFPEKYQVSEQDKMACENVLDAWNAVDVILTISDSTSHDVTSLLKHDTPVQRVGAGTDFVHLGHPTFSLPKTPRRVLFVGGADVRKNPTHAVKAAEIAASILKQRVQLTFIGPGTRELLLTKEDRAISITRLGEVPDETIHRAFHTHDALIFPSSYEGAGLPLIEAAAAGIPAVAYDVSSIPEYIGPHGYLSPAGDVENLGQNLAVALEEAPGSAVEERRAWVQDYSWPAVAARVADVALSLPPKLDSGISHPELKLRPTPPRKTLRQRVSGTVSMLAPLVPRRLRGVAWRVLVRLGLR